MIRLFHCVMLAALVVVCVEAGLSCGDINSRVMNNCSCDGKENDIVVQCGDLLKITALNGNEEVYVSCNKPITSIVILPSLKVGDVVDLTLDNCLTEKVSVRDILDQLGVDNVGTMKVTGREETLVKGKLENLTRVDRIILNSLGLSHIDPYVFGDQNSRNSPISQLFVENNTITKLDYRVLNKLPHLLVLSLTYNQLSTFPKQIFRYNSLLMELLLGYNQLENVDSLFGGTSNAPDNYIFYYLELNNNKITELDGRVFYKLRRLEYLDMSFNELTHLPADIFKFNNALVHIDLSNNQLENIESTTLSNLNHLKWLNLAQNRLKYIDDRLLYTTQTLQYLDLSHNQLTFLSDDTVYHLQSLDILSLHHNPWRCWCEDLELLRLVHNRDKVKNAGMTKCENGRVMTNLRVFDFCCPVSCSNSNVLLS